MSSWNIDQKMNFWSLIAYIGSMIALIVTLFIMRCNINQQRKIHVENASQQREFHIEDVKQQRKFHIDALRAWVSIEPRTTIEVKENAISYKINYKNYGESPAFNFQSSAQFYYKDYLLQGDSLCNREGEDEVYATLFPDKNYPTSPTREIQGYYGNYKKAEIIDLIKKRELYLFVSVSYEDFSNKKRYFSIFQLPIFIQVKPTADPQAEKPNIIHIKLMFIQDSQKRCIKIPELD